MIYSFTRMMWHHVRSQLAAAAFLLASAAVVFGQSAPPTMPDKTVYGRLGTGTGSGPAQAIPFNTLANQLFPTITSGKREVLTGNLVEYVNGNAGSSAACGPTGALTCAAGVDAGNCRTPATACLTLTYAHSLIVAGVDFAYQYSGTIYLAHNTGTQNYALFSAAGPWIGTSVISITGDSTNIGATVIQDATSGAGVFCKDLCTLSYSNVTFADNAGATGTAHISVGNTGNAGHIDVVNIILSGTNSNGVLMTAGALGSITLNGPITIAGGAAQALQATNGGLIDFSGQTVTITGTPAFSQFFAFMINGGSISANTSTFSGSATGTRCLIVGPLNLGGFDPNAVFPGNANCVQNEPVGAIGIQNGSTFGYGTANHPLLSGGGASAKDVWDTAGVSCPSGITAGTVTVVAGIVTHC